MSTTPMMDEFINVVEQIAAANHAHHIDVVTVELGAKCNVTPFYFREQFCEASRNTILEGAELHFIMGTDEADKHAEDVVLWGLELT